MRGTAPMVVSVAEAAAALGVCTDAVYTLVRTGELRAARVGRRWLIPRAELARLLPELSTRDVEKLLYHAEMLLERQERQREVRRSSVIADERDLA